MVKKCVSIIFLVLCIGLIATGCPKKTVVKEEPSVSKTGSGSRRERQRGLKPNERKRGEGKRSSQNQRRRSQRKESRAQERV